MEDAGALGNAFDQNDLLVPIQGEYEVQRDLECTSGARKLVGFGNVARLRMANHYLKASGECNLLLKNMVVEGQNAVRVIGSVARLYYALPAPLGKYVGGGRLRTCSQLPAAVKALCDDDSDQVIEFTEGTLDAHREALPADCFAGFVGDSTGSTAQRSGMCNTACPVGNFCPKGSSQPTPCAPGTFNPLQGASLSACVPCPRGSQCAGGQASHVLCPVNSFQRKAGKAECQSCPDGMSCPEGAVEPRTVPCTLGSYCPVAGGGGECLDDPSKCELCPVAHSCDGLDALPCPEGTHSTQLGERRCTPCPAGSYMNNEVYQPPKPSPPPPSPLPPPPLPPPTLPPAPSGAVCTNFCQWGYVDSPGGVASDGVCDDGGPGSAYSNCYLGHGA